MTLNELQFFYYEVMVGTLLFSSTEIGVWIDQMSPDFANELKIRAVS